MDWKQIPTPLRLQIPPSHLCLCLTAKQGWLQKQIMHSPPHSLLYRIALCSSPLFPDEKIYNVSLSYSQSYNLVLWSCWWRSWSSLMHEEEDDTLELTRLKANNMMIRDWLQSSLESRTKMQQKNNEKASSQGEKLCRENLNNFLAYTLWPTIQNIILQAIKLRPFIWVLVSRSFFLSGSSCLNIHSCCIKCSSCISKVPERRVDTKKEKRGRMRRWIWWCCTAEKMIV